MFRIGIVATTAAFLGLGLCAFADFAHASVEISSKPTQAMSCVSGTCTPTSAKAILNVDDLIAMLNSSDVIIESGSIAQNIEVDAELTWTSTKRLTFDAYTNIVVNKVITVPGSSAMTLLYDDGDSAGGDMKFLKAGRLDYASTADDLEINGEKYVLAANIQGLASLAKQGQIRIALARNQNLLKHGVFKSAPIPDSTSRFEGLGHTISNLSVDDTADNDLIGLFAQIHNVDGNEGVRDFKLVSVNIVGEGQDQLIGGLIGAINNNLIQNCTVSGKVTGTAQFSGVGGLTGGSSGYILDSSSSASVSAAGLSFAAGGLVGHSAFGVIAESYSTGSVTSGDQVPTGGLVGYNHAAAIENSYATGAVSGGSTSYVGGLIGEFDDQNPNLSHLNDSYSTGLVNAGSDALVGGLIGWEQSIGPISHAYWDLDTSGISDPSQGAGNGANDTRIRGLTTKQFKSKLPKGFGRRTWKENSSLNSGYPYLLDNTPR